MAVSELMMEGVNLMVIGMGTVFVFLAVMVASVVLMSKLARKIEGATPPPDAGDGAPDDHIAAIGAAIRRHRDSRSS